MIRFDEELELAGNGGVDAHGPLDPLSGLPPLFKRLNSSMALSKSSSLSPV